MSSLSGYVFCLSGTLTEGRAKVTKTINQNGGDVASTVNAKVTHLVTTPAEVAANTKKVITAQTKGTPIVAEGFLRDLLAGKRANVSKYSLTGGADDEEEEEEEEEVEVEVEDVDVPAGMGVVVVVAGDRFPAARHLVARLEKAHLLPGLLLVKNEKGLVEVRNA
eukprot:TRINITY_DN60_c1_g1_i3.p2 TRINITY_DN60_c1_g1~~TRINITY_DN60_c1_g1_i3.p2  ORF type:complete len:183 (-),score=67.70 TRINITY_DN60_c1_g1_i3:343-837(-)